MLMQCTQYRQMSVSHLLIMEKDLAEEAGETEHSCREPDRNYI